MTDWILSSSVLIAAVIALRAVTKGRISMRLRYGLWALVLVRLLIPGNFIPSDFSIEKVALFFERQPQVQQISQQLNTPQQSYDAVYREVVKEHYEVYYPQEATVPEVLPESFTATLPAQEQAQIRQEAQLRVEQSAPIYSLKQILLGIWILGMAVSGTFLLTVNLSFARRLKRTRQRVEGDAPVPVYKSFMAETPCLFGLFRPVIYITGETAANPKALPHILAHESSHYYHKDHIWAFLRCVCLALHWYNPLVWLAVFLSRRDCELACDEATIRRIGEENRINYGRTLVEMTCIKRAPSAVLLTATTMLSDKKTLTQRIQQVARKPRVLISAVVTAVIIAAVAVGCTFTGAPNETTAPTEPAETTAPTQPPETTAPPQTTAPTQPAETTEPPRVDTVAEQTMGAVHSYPLEIRGGLSLQLMGNNYLLYSANGNTRTLTLLSGEDFRILAQRELPEPIAACAADETRILYYAPETHACVFLDGELKETKRIKLPGTLGGSANEVLFTQDMRAVYYPTPGLIECFDLELEQSRQSFQTPGTLRALCFDGTNMMMMCEAVQPTGEGFESSSVFVSTTWGHEVARDSSYLGITTWGSNYFISRTADYRTEYLYGSLTGEVQSFSPRNRGQKFVLPQLTGVISADNNAPVHLEYYDLASGKRTAIVDFPGNAAIPYRGYTASADGKYICFLGLDENSKTTLYRWEPAMTPSGDDFVYIGPRYTAENPDLEGLAACEERIQKLEEQYSLDIRINREPRLPQGYGYLPLYDVPEIHENLDYLESALGQYPAELIRTAASLSDSGRLNIGIVTIIESPGDEFQMSLHYYDQGSASMVLQGGLPVSQLFHRELAFYIDEYIRANSDVLETWETLNPEGFTYYGSYEAVMADNTAYWEGDFADKYAMASPVYDRVAVMEYATVEGAASVFNYDRMQAKLRLWCQAIREVFDLENVSTPFLWEQHLNEPLA